MIQPLKWHGGKGRLASQILEHIPEHTRYLEPYAGGLSVLLRKPCEGVAEWVNDTNNELTNFWAVLADDRSFLKFQRTAEATPMSETVFDWACRSIAYGRAASPVERAFRFFVMMRQSRQGLGGCYATPTSRTRRGMNENVSAWLSAVEGLADVHERLKRVEIWNRPAVEAIQKLDGADLVVYADPPYLHETRATVGEYGDHEMTTDDHVELLETLGRMRGRFILSGYRSSPYDHAAQHYGWRIVEIETTNNASSSKKKERRVECLWMNY